MHRASAALRDATPILGSREFQFVPQDSKQRHVWHYIDFKDFAIHIQFVFTHSDSYSVGHTSAKATLGILFFLYWLIRVRVSLNPTSGLVD